LLGPWRAAAAADGSVYIATGNAMWAVASKAELKSARDNYFTDLKASSKSPADVGDYFMSVLRVKLVPGKFVPGTPTSNPAFEESRLEIVDWFQPKELIRPRDGARYQKAGATTESMTLQEMDCRDMDFGSSSFLVLPEIGGKRLIVISTKDLVFFSTATILVDRENLL
jgi:hypothetical protein